MFKIISYYFDDSNDICRNETVLFQFKIKSDLTNATADERYYQFYAL